MYFAEVTYAYVAIFPWAPSVPKYTEVEVERYFVDVFFVVFQSVYPSVGRRWILLGSGSQGGVREGLVYFASSWWLVFVMVFETDKPVR